MVRRGLEWRAAARVAASAGRQVLGRAGAQVATSGLRSVVRANAFAAVATGVAEQVIDTARLARGQIDCDEYGARSAENLARTGGAAGGAALGAAVGSAVPVLGTTIGALIGGFLGSLLGEGLASAAIR